MEWQKISSCQYIEAGDIAIAKDNEETWERDALTASDFFKQFSVICWVAGDFVGWYNHSIDITLKKKKMFFTGQARKRILQVKLRNLNFPYFANSRFVWKQSKVFYSYYYTWFIVIIIMKMLWNEQGRLELQQLCMDSENKIRHLLLELFIVHRNQNNGQMVIPWSCQFP